MNPHYERGRQLMSHNRTKEAIAEFRKELAQNPENPFAFALLSNCYLQERQFAEALEVAKRAIQLEPEIPELYSFLGQAYYYNKKSVEAREAVEAGLQLNPNHAPFYHLLGTIDLYEEDWNAALQHAEQGLEIDAEHVDLINLRAQALIQLNRKDEASATLDYALHKAPENAFSHTNKGWVAVENDQYDDAIEHFKEALRLDPTFKFARTGLKEAIKGKNYLYRGVLKYFLWMSKQTSNNQWAIVIGAYVIYRLLLAALDSYPALAPLLYPLIFAYIIFVFSSWIAKPISNLFLRLHPLGKHALDDDERLASTAVGLVVTFGIVTLLLGWMMSNSMLLILGIFGVLMTIPTSGLFNTHPESQARKSLTYYAIALGMIGFGVIFIPALQPFMIVFGLGIFFYSWIANYFIGRESKEFY